MKKRKKRGRVNFERDVAQKRIREQRGGFKCCNCRQQVVINSFIGTSNRNHCNACLWSKHVDEKKGDRRASCQARMKPVGLTFRIENKERRGEIMLIHVCSGCPKISINRIAADDMEHEIFNILRQSFSLSDEAKRRIAGDGILLALKSDTRLVQTQLRGI